MGARRPLSDAGRTGSSIIFFALDTGVLKPCWNSRADSAGLDQYPAQRLFQADHHGIYALPTGLGPQSSAGCRRESLAIHVEGRRSGITLLAFVINAVELIGSAGLPAAYTQVLAMSHLPLWMMLLFQPGWLNFT